METNLNMPGSQALQNAESQEGEAFSLRDILDIFLNHWKWFLFSAIVCLALSQLYLATKSRIYQRQAVILVKEDASTGGRKQPINTDALMQLNGVMGNTSVKNELYILRSYQLMQEVVKDLQLDIQYTCKQGLRTVSLYKERPFTITFHEEIKYATQFKLTISNAREGVISDVRYGKKFEEVEFTKTIPFGQTVATPFGNITIETNAKTLELFEGKTITVTRQTLETAAIVTCNKIETSEMDKMSTLVIITCQDTNIQRADDILNSILEAYKRSIVKSKNQMAQTTAEFIDERIKIISVELGEVEGELADYKQKHGVVDAKSSASDFLNQTSIAHQRTIQAESQYAMLQYLVDYIMQNSEGNTLIPTMGGIADPGIMNQINLYNQLMLKRNAVAENAGADSPSIVDMESDLRQMRTAIVASLKGYSSSLKLQVDKARQEERGLTGTLASLPQKEKDMIDISRQQAIKETLFTFLLNKREETALQLAITEANISIVEHPFGSSAPVAPRKKIFMLVGLMLGLGLPFAFFYIMNMLNMGVRGRKDVETYTTIPVLGEIPHRKDGFDDSDIVVDENGDDVLGEAFRMLRFSMGFINREARVIMFTSTMPGEGKTFISRNFSATLSLAGKKVILIDADIRKRTQSKLYSSGRRDGLTSYLSGATSDLQSLIVHENKDYDLDFLPAGIMPPNPAELLMSKKLDELIEELKKAYDYIVIDNVPAQAVADAGIVNRVADLTIYVIREGRVDRRFLPELERLHQEQRFKNLCIIINDAHLEKKKYGYGYGYGYGAKEEKSGRGLSRFFRK